MSRGEYAIKLLTSLLDLQRARAEAHYRGLPRIAAAISAYEQEILTKLDRLEQFEPVSE